jgi:hypothetical protein
MRGHWRESFLGEVCKRFLQQSLLVALSAACSGLVTLGFGLALFGMASQAACRSLRCLGLMSPMSVFKKISVLILVRHCGSGRGTPITSQSSERKSWNLARSAAPELLRRLMKSSTEAAWPLWADLLPLMKSPLTCGRKFLVRSGGFARNSTSQSWGPAKRGLSRR